MRVAQRAEGDGDAQEGFVVGVRRGEAGVRRIEQGPQVEAVEGGVVVVVPQVLLGGAEHEVGALAVEAGHLLTGGEGGEGAEAEEAQREGTVHR